jgi:hypothetical protein
MYVVLMFALLAGSDARAQVWKSKPPEKWTEKDVAKILNDSPWAKTVLVPYSPYLSGDKPEVVSRTQIGGVPYDCVNDPRPTACTDTFKPNSIFVLRWNSARIVQLALQRDATQRGNSSPTYTERSARQEDEIELVLIPQGQTMLPPAEIATLVRTTYLECQPSRERILPLRANSRKVVDSSGRESYVFVFPASRTDASPTIPPGTTVIEFFSQVGPRVFAAKFKLRDMQSPSGPDF